MVDIIVGELYIIDEHYYLIPEKRGLELSKEVHRYVLQLFRKHGISEYHLRVSLSNKYAISFYYRNEVQEIEN